MIKGVSHIGIAVKDLDAATRAYTQALGVKAGEVHHQPDMEAVMIPVGDVALELLQPKSSEAAVAKFIESRGEGIHHICLEVDNIDKELAALTAKGVKLVDKVAKQGIEGKIAFIHPKAMNGVLVELVQK